MRSASVFFLFLFAVIRSHAQDLPLWKAEYDHAVPADWLITPPAQKASVYRSADGKEITLYNGLLKRSFRITPNVACYDFRNMSNGQQLLRAIRPEAKLEIEGKQFHVGGLEGQKEKGYFRKEWLDSLRKGENDLSFLRYEISDVKPVLNWNRKTWASITQHTGGKILSFFYGSADESLKGLEVVVHYELYDGLPLIVKWVSLKNNTGREVVINRIVNESLGLVEEESAVVGSPEQMKKQHGIYVETNYAFNNAMRYDISDQTTHWITDSSYTSQVNYNYQTPCVLEVYPEKAKAVTLQKGELMKSVRTHELLMDSYDRQRRGLMIQRMYAAVAPWTTQNPIFMHLVSRNDQEVFTAIDQCAATGYEALILSFGSHCNMEDVSAANVAKWKKIADYAHSKGILIGSYSLFSSRRINDETDVIDPKTGKPGGAFFGNAPCMGSKWGLAYIDNLKYFIKSTGFDLFENDGPYPGDVCASTVHPGHKGLDDSQWRQMELQKGLYRWCNENGVYVNAPDWYFLDGTHKIALGYREVNFSLSREQQKILNRQNIHDGTHEKLPSMGWGFVPLTRYQGGGPEAILEPLKDHLKDYEMLMVQYYGAGVQACYRGPRLYDTDSTKVLVTNTVSWYKQYRGILNAPIVHLRRADGRDWDGFMHVSTTLRDRAFVLLFNPTKEPIVRKIKLPVYYSALKGMVQVVERDKHALSLQVSTDHFITVECTIPAEGYTWYVLRAQDRVSHDDGYRGGTIEGLKRNQGTLDFLVVGDWGRNGEYFQKDVALQMGKAAHQLHIDFVVSTGDNFYPRGVMGVQDPQWKSSFEDIYTAHALNTYWYPVLGNHDYAGDPEAEIAYSKISRRWKLPARYHSMEVSAGDGTKVLMVFLDTSPLEKRYYKGGEPLFSKNILSQDTAAQMKWLRQTLAASDARWKIVFGHHPLYTSGPRKGTMGEFAAHLQPALDGGKADMYIAGHEHILEHDVLSPTLHHIISGAGSQVTPSSADKRTKFVASAHGFITCSVNKEELLVQFIDHEGKLLYAAPIRK